MKRWWLIVLVLVVLVVGGWWLVQDRVIRHWLESALAPHVGGTPQVESVQTRWRSSRITLSGIQLAATDDWPLDASVMIRTVDLRYRLTRLFGSVVELPELLLDIEQVTVTIPPDGQLDFSTLGRPQTPDTADPPPAPEPTTPDAVPAAPDEAVSPPRAPQPERSTAERRARELQVGDLTFRLGTIKILEEDADGGEPHVREYRLNYERNFTDASDLEDVLQKLGSDLVMALAPHLLREAFSASPRSRSRREVESPPAEDLEALGSQLDEETKDLQREMRRLRREFMDQ